MAISWGSWEGSGNAMRVGIEVDWEAVTNGEPSATATVRIYTQNNFSWSDDQSLNFGGSIGGSAGFHNGQGDGTVTLRATKSYTYTYGGSEYGKSPGNRTFTATLTGAYNGITPSKSVTSAIPERPIAAPNPPTNASVSRVNDAGTRVTWANKSTAARPWNNITVQRSINDGAFATVTASIAGGATSYVCGSAPNDKYRFRVSARNQEGSSANDETGDIYTTPSTPTAATRTGANGANQAVGWSNNSVGYSEYSTDVWRCTNGTWAFLVTVAGGLTTYTDTYPATHPADTFKYRVRHRTTAGAQGTLFSEFSNETTETAGVTAPPLTPAGLAPSNFTVDPTLPIRLSWSFQPDPSTPSDTQQEFEARHRVAGSADWIAATGTTSQFYDIPSNTYGEQTIVEWQVAAKGADPAWSPFTEPVSFQTAVAAIAPDPVKLPVLMDLYTGQLEASATAFEVRNYALRAQSNLMGGGVRAVDTSYNVSWSQRFIAIDLGRSQATFPNGHHDILSPWNWSVSTKAISATGGADGKSRVTIGITIAGSNTNRIRVGDTVTVSGMGAPYDGQHVIRETTTTSLKYDINPTSSVSQTAATGQVSATIHGHGGAVDNEPTSGKVPLANWTALWYELPFGWGAGTTPRKNGVVKVTEISLASNVVTATVQAPHHFAVGDRITISGAGSPYDGIDRVITGLTAGTVSFALTNANISSSSPSGALASPSGKDTFFSNFHLVAHTSDFVVPDNWVMVALRNGDAFTVEWGSGDTVDPGFDSDSPVFKQAIFTSTSDVTTAGNNKPAIRIGDTTASHLRMDGDEIQRMVNLNTTGTIGINAGGGHVTLGNSGSIVSVAGNLDNPGAPTGSFTANVNMTSPGGRLRRDTSSRQYKENEREIEIDIEAVLELKPKTFQRNDEHDPVTGKKIGFRKSNPWYYGFVAEDARDIGGDLLNWVVFDSDGEVDSFAYDKWTVALQAVCQSQQKRIADLEARLGRLESALASHAAQLAHKPTPKTTGA